MVSVFSSNENAALDRQLDINEQIYRNINVIWDDENQTKKCAKWIRENNFRKVCLQFPDDLLKFSHKIAQDIRSHTDAQIFILGDTSYGSCCVDEIAAQHVFADAIIHFGHACLSKSVRIPVFYVFFKFDIDVEHFLKIFTDNFKDCNEKLGIFYDVGYLHAVEQIAKELTRYTKIEIGRLCDYNDEPDILCWNLPNESMENFTCIYIGHDSLSFSNIQMGIKCLKWILYDTNVKKMNETIALDSKWIKRRYFYVEKCKDAQSIGIVVATLTSKGYLDVVKRVQEMAKKHGVRTYILSVGKINPAKLANFSEIDCFVLIGCPENDIFTKSKEFYKPLVSVFEFEMAFNPAWKNQMPDSYSTDFKEILPAGRLHRVFDEHDIDKDVSDMSLVSGKVRRIRSDQDVGSKNDCFELLLKANNEISEITSSDTFQNRAWQGLEQNLGQNEPSVVEDGRQGIPMKYTNDPMEF